MPALDQSLGDILILFAVLFGLVDIFVYWRLFQRTHGQRRSVAGLVLFASVYTVAVYFLSITDTLPDGAETLSFLLRPALVGLLGFLALFGLMERRH